MKTISLATLALPVLFVLSACGGLPVDTAKHADYYAGTAKASLAKGEMFTGYINIIRAVGMPGGGALVSKMFSDHPATRASFIAATSARIDDIAGVGTAARFNEHLNKIDAAGILSAAEVQVLRSRFDALVIAGNQSDALPFVVDADTLTIAVLARPDHARRIFDRTISSYRAKDYAPRNIESVIKFTRSPIAPAGSERTLVEALPFMHIRADELAAVSSLAPQFAAKRRADLSLTAQLVVKNADRIFADDVMGELKKSSKGITWLTTPAEGGIDVVVERVRHSERDIPQATRTVTYSQAQVDFVSAALLMPRNASYQFDLTTGGSEIDYGYVVSTWRGKTKLSEEVVRGKVGGAAQRCANARIVNVFGGVTAADFSANDDMRSACGGSSPASMDDLRTEVLAKIAAQVIAAPQIAAVHELN